MEKQLFHLSKNVLIWISVSEGYLFKVACVSLLFLCSGSQMDIPKLWAEGLIGTKIIFTLL